MYLATLKPNELEKIENIKVIVFDADDTLWANEPRFREAENRVATLLGDYCTPKEMSETLYGIEVRNMKDYGFGTKAFTLSMLETATKISKGRLTGVQTEKILEIGRELLHNPAIPLNGVFSTLKTLRSSGRYKMAVMTKGELLDQENKLERSGLMQFFNTAEVVSNKTTEEYSTLCSKLGIDIENMLMVGNSFKSDIAPVLELGGYGAHIPFHVLWELEKMEEYDHKNLRRLESFTDLLNIVPIN